MKPVTETLVRKLRTCVMSGDPLVVVHSRDHGEALLNVLSLCSEQQWHLLVHNLAVGLLPTIAAVNNYITTGSPEDPSAPSVKPPAQAPGLPGTQPPPASPQAITASVRTFLAAFPGDKQSAVLVLHNAHRALSESVGLMQTVQDALGRLKASGKTIIILTHRGAALPPELEPYYTTVVHEEPDLEELAQTIATVALDDDEPVEPALLKQAAVAAAGLTRQQAESAAARCIMRNGKLVPSFLWEHKVELFNHDGLVSVFKPTAGLSALGGLNFFKDVLAKQVAKGNLHKILSVGAPGCGKTSGAFALGLEYKINVLEARLGVLFGKYVGESEARTRQMQEIIEKNSPCIVVMDELPRYLSTDSQSSDEAGGGVNAKVAAEWLTWLSSPRAADVMIVATANSWTGIDTLTRAERFDFNVFTSIVSSEEKLQAIWDIHLNANGHTQVDPELRSWLIAQSTHWTGAEIKAICRLSADKCLEEPITDTINRVRIDWDSRKRRRLLKRMEREGRDSSLINVETGFKFNCREYKVTTEMPAIEVATVETVPAKAPRRRVKKDASS